MYLHKKTIRPGRGHKIISWMLAVVCLGLFLNLARALFLDTSSAKAFPANLLSDDVGLALFYFLISLALFLVVRSWRFLFKKSSLLNLALVGGSIIVAVVILELALMPFDLVFNAATTGTFNFQNMKRLTDKKDIKAHTWTAKMHSMQKDQELGYIPLMGDTYTYSQYGAQQNPYPFNKRPGVTRVVLAGDSICALGFLADGLKAVNPNKNYEYWVTGVYGYGTVQEIRYFERYGSKLKPDVLILEFCLNDWDGTPVILKDKENQTVIANLYLGTEHFNPWLFRNSTLYRVYLSLKASLTDRGSLTKDVERNIAKLQDYARKDNFELRVVVYPELAPLKKWPPRFLQQRRDILDILTRLQIKHYDAAPLLDQALKTHPQKWSRLAPDDHFHPSPEFSRMIAAELLKKGFLK